MDKIILQIVGAGALGSHVVEEIVKSFSALGFQADIHLHDFDQVEERNLFSQNFTPADLGKNKAEAMAKKLKNYNGIKIIPHTEKLAVSETEVSPEVLDFINKTKTNLIIDVVDNVSTRKGLGVLSLLSGVAVCHGGISFGGQGNVSWTSPTHNTSVFSPTSTDFDLINKMKEQGDIKQPPCVLSSQRFLIVSCAMAVTKAVLNYLGRDVDKDFTKYYKANGIKFLMADYMVNSNGFAPNPAVNNLQFLIDSGMVEVEEAKPEAPEKAEVLV